MADGVVQYIKLMIDKASVARAAADAKAAGATIGAAAAGAITSNGGKAGQAMIADMVKKLQEGAAAVKQAVASGLLTEDQGRKAGDKLGRDFVSSLTKSLSGMKAMGLITQKEFDHLQGSAVPALKAIQAEFRKVQAEEDKTEKKTGYLAKSFEHIAERMAEYFAIREIINFGKETVGAFEDIQAEMNRTAATLATVGIPFESVRKDLDAHSEAMGKLGIKNVEYYKTFNMILGITHDYNKAIHGTDAAFNLAITSGRSSETTARAIGRAYEGVDRTLKMMLPTYDKHRDVAEQINAATGEQARNKAAGFAGSVGQIARAWDDFKEVLGQAITQMGGGTSVIDVLIAGIRGMTQWVKENADTIKQLGGVAVGVFQLIGAGLLILDAAWKSARVVIASVALGVDDMSAAFQSFFAMVTLAHGKSLQLVAMIHPAYKAAADAEVAEGHRMQAEAEKDRTANLANFKKTIAEIRAGTDKLGKPPVNQPGMGNNKPGSSADAELKQEITMLRDRLKLNENDAEARARLLEIQTQLTARMAEAKGNAVAEHDIAQRLLKVRSALALHHQITAAKQNSTLTHEIDLLGKGLLLSDQRVQSAAKLDAMEATITKKLENRHLTLEQEIRLQDHLKEIQKARETPDVALGTEITSIKERLALNINDAEARTRLVAIQTDLTARAAAATKNSLAYYAALKMLTEVTGALAKDTITPLQEQARLLHEMAAYPETRNKGIADGIPLLAQVNGLIAAGVKDEKEMIALLAIRNQLTKDAKGSAAKELEKDASKQMGLVKSARSQKERDEALAALRKLDERLKEMAATSGDPAEVSHLQTTINQVDKYLALHPLQAKPFFKDLSETLQNSLPNIAESAAANMVNSFELGFNRMIRNMGQVRNAALGMTKGMAAGFAKELGAMAKLKAKENLAHAVEKGAMAVGEMFHNPAAAVADAKSAAGFLAAAAEWGALGGAAGGGSAGGGGGRVGATQGRNTGAYAAQMSAPQTTEVHVHVDGIDPKNLRHQELAGQVVQSYAERTGGSILTTSG